MPAARITLTLTWLGLASLAALAPAALAQTSADTQALNAALTRLAGNPRDPAALIDAGNAALSMGDGDAAAGFFSRAEEVAPGNPRAKAGLARAAVYTMEPFTAIRLFGEAERAGPLTGDALIDRGLAHDLVGDNVTAQRYYRLAGPANSEALRRLSLSLAISGDKRASEATLAPLLARQDKSAWRVRAFSLAILGETAQAVSIATATLPAGLAGGISPYLKYMGQLTRAQQAAAANLGHFPRASEIGRDDPRIAQLARPAAAPVARGADAGLIPSGQPLGKAAAQRQEQVRKADAKRERERAKQASRERIRPPDPVVTTTTTAVALAPAAAPPAAPAPAARPVALAAAKPAAAARPATSAAAPVLASPARPIGPPAQDRPVQGPSFELLAAPAKQPATVTPQPSAAPPPPPVQQSAPPPPPLPQSKPPAPQSLADAFSEFTRPTISTTPAPGSVDVRKIKAAKPTPPKAAKPAPPPHPSRIWVQVATGRDKKALAFDWRKMAKQSASLFKGRKPYVTAWNQTNRLLTGPFETEAAASSFMNQLRKEDIAGAFLWTSPAGQVVDNLSVGK